MLQHLVFHLLELAGQSFRREVDDLCAVGGALVGQSPSSHTYKTKSFPLDLFRRDQARAEAIAHLLPTGLGIAEASVRFACHLPGVTTVLLGFADPDQVDSAMEFASKGPLPAEVWRELERHSEQITDAVNSRNLS